MLRSTGTRLAQIAVLCLSLAAWEAASSHSPGIAFFVSRPSSVAVALGTDIRAGGILTDLGITFGSALAGLTFGAAVAMIVAIALAVFPPAHVVLKPFLSVVAAVPVIALAPVLILAFGTGVPLEFAIAALSVFLVVVAQAHESLAAARNQWDELARADGVSRFRFFSLVVLPGAAMWIFAGMRSAVGFALLGAFIGEFISSERGIGRYVLRFAALYDSSRVMAGLVLIGAAAYTITWLIERLQNFLIPPVQGSGDEI